MRMPGWLDDDDAGDVCKCWPPPKHSNVQIGISTLDVEHGPKAHHEKAWLTVSSNLLQPGAPLCRKAQLALHRTDVALSHIHRSSNTTTPFAREDKVCRAKSCNHCQPQPTTKSPPLSTTAPPSLHDPDCNSLCSLAQPARPPRALLLIYSCSARVRNRARSRTSSARTTSVHVVHQSSLVDHLSRRRHLHNSACFRHRRKNMWARLFPCTQRILLHLLCPPHSNSRWLKIQMGFV